MPEMEFKGKDFKVRYQENPENKEEVYNKVRDFFLTNQCFHKETVCQSDRVIENAYDLLSDLVELFEFDVEWKDD